MSKKHNNDFKAMIVRLLKFGIKPKGLGEEYGLNYRYD